MKYQFEYKEIEQCGQCPCLDCEYHVCALTGNETYQEYDKPNDCPLVATQSIGDDLAPPERSE